MTRSAPASPSTKKTKKQLSIAIASFPYAGTSSGSSVIYDHVPWAFGLGQWSVKDKRVSEVILFAEADTPVTMTRNRAVQMARAAGVDLLVMIDSDQVPDCERNKDPRALPFIQSSFDDFYKNWSKGPRAIFAPYCGPPPHGSVYVFRWESGYSPITTETPLKLAMYGREEAAQFRGILPVAAGPTGLSMYDMRVFDLVEPVSTDESGAPIRAEHHRGMFYYEWTDKYASQKASTEDVTFFRDLSLIGWEKLGRDVVFCNWDAWAGHNKTTCVGKPQPLYASDANEKYRQAILAGHQRHQTVSAHDFTKIVS